MIQSPLDNDTLFAPLMEGFVHELRNSLTTLSCAQQLMEAKAKKEQCLRSSAKQIGDQVNRLTQMAHQLDHLSRKPKSGVTSCDLLHLVQATIKLECQEGAKTPSIQGATQELSQALHFLGHHLALIAPGKTIYGHTFNDSEGCHLHVGLLPTTPPTERPLALKKLTHPADPASPLNLQVAGRLLHRSGLRLNAYGENAEGRIFLILIPTIPNVENNNTG